MIGERAADGLLMNPSPRRLLVDLDLPIGPPYSCPYLVERMATERAFMVAGLIPGFYERLLAFGWRRNGHVIYKPFCDSCTACVPQRIPTFHYSLSRNERRVLARNKGVRMEVRGLSPDPDRFELFVRYQQGRHAGNMCTDWMDFVQALYTSPLDTRELAFFDGDRLLAAAIIDCEPNAISAVYTYFDPDESRRGLGTLAILRSIEFARSRGIEHYYLGYYVASCDSMSYKARFRPCEYGNMLGDWQRIERSNNSDSGK